MKKFLFLAFLVSLSVFPAMAQDSDVSPNVGNNDVSIQGSGGSRALGDVLFHIDVESIPADNGCLGVEFTGTHFYVSSRGTAGPVLHQYDQTGALTNTWPQTGVTGWGWRDLAWDGTYLYAGDDSLNPGKITIIDPNTGATLGTYGPFPVVPCRALAYHEPTDSFFTGSFSSSIYQCFRDGTSTMFPDTLGAKYGAAYCDATGMIWWWDQTAGQAAGYEWDPGTGAYTGTVFNGDPMVLGPAGGACIYVNDDVNDGVHTNVDGIWKLVGLSQSTPDTIVGYNLDLKQNPLVRLPTEYDDPGAVGAGANIQFDMYAAGQGGRVYGVFGGISGVSPGTPLPGGLFLPVNWDVITNTLINSLGWAFGNLDANGKAQRILWLPPGLGLPGTVPIYFAYCCAFPYDFVSNSVQVDLIP